MEIIYGALFVVCGVGCALTLIGGVRLMVRDHMFAGTLVFISTAIVFYLALRAERLYVEALCARNVQAVESVMAKETTDEGEPDSTITYALTVSESGEILSLRRTP